MAPNSSPLLLDSSNSTFGPSPRLQPSVPALSPSSRRQYSAPVLTFLRTRACLVSSSSALVLSFRPWPIPVFDDILARWIMLWWLKDYCNHWPTGSYYTPWHPTPHLIYPPLPSLPPLFPTHLNLPTVVVFNLLLLHSLFYAKPDGLPPCSGRFSLQTKLHLDDKWNTDARSLPVFSLPEETSLSIAPCGVEIATVILMFGHHLCTSLDRIKQTWWAVVWTEKGRNQNNDADFRKWTSRKWDMDFSKWKDGANRKGKDGNYHLLAIVFRGQKLDPFVGQKSYCCHLFWCFSRLAT